MTSSALSIEDLNFEECLCTVHKFCYDVVSRKGRSRIVECYSSSHKNFVGIDLAIFEFNGVENLELFWGDEMARLKILGTMKETYESIGERCLLSLSEESTSSGVLYYAIQFENFVFRIVLGFAFLENGDNPIEMSHPLVKYFLKQHANIGLRT